MLFLCIVFLGYRFSWVSCCSGFVLRSFSMGTGEVQQLRLSRCGSSFRLLAVCFWVAVLFDVYAFIVLLGTLKSITLRWNNHICRVLSFYVALLHEIALEYTFPFYLQARLKVT